MEDNDERRLFCGQGKRIYHREYVPGSSAEKLFMERYDFCRVEPVLLWEQQVLYQ